MPAPSLMVVRSATYTPAALSFISQRAQPAQAVLEQPVRSTPGTLHGSLTEVSTAAKRESHGRSRTGSEVTP